MLPRKEITGYGLDGLYNAIMTESGLKNEVQGMDTSGQVSPRWISLSPLSQNPHSRNLGPAAAAAAAGSPLFST